MILISHILIALTSVAYATYVFFRPSLTKLGISYGLVGLTVASGTYLIVNAQGHMIESCTMGLLYIAGVSFAMVKAHARLATQQVNVRRDI